MDREPNQTLRSPTACNSGVMTLDKTADWSGGREGRGGRHALPQHHEHKLPAGGRGGGGEVTGTLYTEMWSRDTWQNSGEAPNLCFPVAHLLNVKSEDTQFT